MPKTQTKTKRKTKATPFDDYRKMLVEYLKNEKFPEKLDVINENIRFLKTLYFIRTYRKGSKMHQWFKSLKGEDRVIAIDNLCSPYFDVRTCFGKNPGDQVLRERTLKLLGCPALQ